MSAEQGESPLHRAFCFWYMRKQKQSSATYEDNINPIGSFHTVEEFWRLYDHLVKPDHIKQPTEYHLFVDGVKPTWEDPVNAQGGKWRIRLRKGLGSRYWEELVLAIIGEQFDDSDEICGAVISVRPAEDILSVWTKTADNVEATTQIRDHLRRILHLPSNIPMDYKKHQDSLPDKAGTNTKPTTATATAPAVAPRQHSSVPPRREWGQSVNAESGAEKESTGAHQWERRHSKGAAAVREGLARDPSDERRGFKKPEGDRGWERSRRYQHGNSNTPAETNRWSRGLSVPVTAPPADSSKTEDVQTESTQA